MPRNRWSVTEGGGFEPPMDSRPCRFSRPVHSTALPPLRGPFRGAEFTRRVALAVSQGRIGLIPASAFFRRDKRIIGGTSVKRPTLAALGVIATTGIALATASTALSGPHHVQLG